MPNADLILPGLYGKLPSAGDFVTRRLPHDFVQAWDRWLAQYIVPLMGADPGAESTPLRFLSGQKAFGAAAGIVTASQDRVGRRFPLSFVAMLPTVSAGLANRADAWFVALEDAAMAARDGLSPDQLDTRLSGLELALDAEDESDPLDGMIVWTASSNLYDLDPAAPQAVLTELLTKSLEAS